MYQEKYTDSIKKWIKESRNKDLNIDSKKKLLAKAYNHYLEKDLKSPIYLSSIAYEYYNLKDSLSFFNINEDAITISKKLNKNYALGDSNWNYATYFAEKQNNEKAYKYFNDAFKAFSKENHKFEMARVLYGMAKIKGRYKDYIHSEILNIESIKLLKELNNHKFLVTGYVNLAGLQQDIKEYDKALEYYEKAKYHLKKLKKIPVKYNFIENNIANIYFEKKEYNKALNFYEKNLKKEITKFHLARVLDNRAYCKLTMKDTLGVKKDFFRALHIRDSLNNKTGITYSKIHISDYYK